MQHGFVYLWFDRKHTRYYIGAHWGTKDDGYICSSKWMKNAYFKRSQDFKRRIISEHSTKEEMFQEEQRLLNMIKEHELGNRYYNLCTHTFNHWSANSDRKSSFSKRQSDAQRKRFEKGVPQSHRDALSRNGKGKKKSSEHVAKVAAANRGKKRTKEQRQAMTEYRTGRSLVCRNPEEKSRKIREALTGKSLSEEHKAKISAAHKGKQRTTPEEKERLAEIRRQRCKEKRREATLNKKNKA